ncbi:hypothetical protein AALA83_16360 [Oscillospiraceae bacterium 44-5]
MFGFGKKEAKTPEERLAELQKKRDWAGLVKTYYELGVSAMDGGDLNHAQLWLHRADTIYSADDTTYEKVGDKLTDDCSDRIGTLEDEEELFYNAVLAQIEAKAEALNDVQARVWGLLSIARLVKLSRQLSALPGCEALGELDWAVDMMFRSLQTLPPPEEYQRLMDLCNALYELNGKPAYYTGEIEVPGGAPFQMFDWNGMFGVEQELNGYTDSHLRLLAALSQEVVDPTAAPETDVVACALLPDYYVRTGAEDLNQVPQIRAELERIWSDYDFVRSGITWDAVEKKLDEYKQLDILAG